MGNSASDVARRLARVQKRLRGELLEELRSHGDDLENVFDPYSYSPVAHEIREKYLSRLYALQMIIQELAHLNQGQKQPPVRVLRVRARDNEELVKSVNKKLANLNGARIMDVEFLQTPQDEHWVAVITYMANPFAGTPDETAAWM